MMFGEMQMINGDITIISARADEVTIDPNELALRLHTSRGYTDPQIEECRKRLSGVISYKCAYIRTAVDLSEENVCGFGFMTVPSSKLYKNLSGCREAYVMALTTGIAVDRLLARLNITSQAEHFITDGLSSAAAESFCDYVCDILTRDTPCVPRFSPGFGDLSISFQRPLLQRLDAANTLGITLNQAYLMTPVKSITAIMGIKEN